MLGAGSLEQFSHKHTQASGFVFRSGLEDPEVSLLIQNSFVNQAYSGLVGLGN
jgi:hypothetical protein